MFVDTDDIQVTDFDITEVEQQKLFANGEKAARKFLSTWDYQAFQEAFPLNKR